MITEALEFQRKDVNDMSKVITMILPQPAKSLIVDSLSYFDEYRRVLRELSYQEIEQVADVRYEAHKLESRGFLFGDGGSAGLASHVVSGLGKATAGPGMTS